LSAMAFITCWWAMRLRFHATRLTRMSLPSRVARVLTLATPGGFEQLFVDLGIPARQAQPPATRASRVSSGRCRARLGNCRATAQARCSPVMLTRPATGCQIRGRSVARSRLWDLRGTARREHHRQPSPAAGTR
jgi:hypothetical protein